MTRLMPLVRWDGEPVYVNSAQILFMRAAAPGPEGPRSTIAFAFMRWTDGTDHGPMVEVFRGSPSDVAALLSPPLGPS